MSRAKKRAERIRNEVPLDVVLTRYGYDVIPNAEREQQFSCDLHGDGSDSKPSARYYPESTSWHCFACSKSRDAISTVMEKEGKNFSEACTYLEQQYGLPPLPWEPTEKKEKVEIDPRREKTVEETSASLLKSLKSFGIGKDIEIEDLLKLWEIHDMLLYLHREGKVDRQKVMQGFVRIHKTAFRLARENV
tara:strand:+ start:12429 stop:13001 length:573 start_codon:yes stop_codon:yes gene_type:complete